MTRIGGLARERRRLRLEPLQDLLELLLVAGRREAIDVRGHLPELERQPLHLAERLEHRLGGSLRALQQLGARDGLLVLVALDAPGALDGLGRHRKSARRERSEARDAPEARRRRLVRALLRGAGPAGSVCKGRDAGPWRRRRGAPSGADESRRDMDAIMEGPLADGQVSVDASHTRTVIGASRGEGKKLDRTREEPGPQGSRGAPRHPRRTCHGRGRLRLLWLTRPTRAVPLRAEFQSGILSTHAARREHRRRGALSAQSSARPRRDGLGLARHAPRARHPVRRQVHRRGDRRAPRGAGALRARGEGGGAAPQPARRADPRPRRLRGHALHRDGAARGRGPRQAPRARRPLHAARAAVIVDQVCRALTQGARRGHRPPRPQAGQHLPRPRRRPRDRQGARLRHRQERTAPTLEAAATRRRARSSARRTT